MKSRLLSLMHCRWLSVLVVAFGLCGVGALPASAGTVDISVSTQCNSCTYSITVFGELASAGPFTVLTTVHFTSQTTGVVTSVDRAIPVSGPGNYSVTVPDLPAPVDCTDTFDVTADASLTFPNGFTATASFSGATLGGCSPPQGKTFGIGPSSMEGALKIRPGDWISGGYSFKFDGHQGATTYAVTASVMVPFTCPDGSGPGGSILINLGTQSYPVPAGRSDWLPTGRHRMAATGTP
jgi:hypothetical protein